MRERARIVWRQQVRLNIAYATVSSRFARRATPSTFFACGLSFFPCEKTIRKYLVISFHFSLCPRFDIFVRGIIRGNVKIYVKGERCFRPGKHQESSNFICSYIVLGLVFHQRALLFKRERERERETCARYSASVKDDGNVAVERMKTPLYSISSLSFYHFSRVIWSAPFTRDSTKSQAEWNRKRKQIFHVSPTVQWLATVFLLFPLLLFRLRWKIFLGERESGRIF